MRTGIFISLYIFKKNTGKKNQQAKKQQRQKACFNENNFRNSVN